MPSGLTSSTPNIDLYFAERLIEALEMVADSKDEENIEEDDVSLEPSHCMQNIAEKWYTTSFEKNMLHMQRSDKEALADEQIPVEVMYNSTALNIHALSREDRTRLENRIRILDKPPNIHFAQRFRILVW